MPHLEPNVRASAAGGVVGPLTATSATNATIEADPRVALLETQLKKVRYRDDALIEVLHAVQDIYGYLAPAVLGRVARSLGLPESRVMGVATFYHLFTFEARGSHNCTVCTGTACFVKGADALLRSAAERFGVAAGATRDDGALSLLEARCIGACGLAPVALIDGVVLGRATLEALNERLANALMEVST